MIIAVLNRWGRLRSGPQILNSHLYPFLTDVTSLIITDVAQPRVLSLYAATGVELWSWRPQHNVLKMSLTSAQGSRVVAVMYLEERVQGCGSHEADSPSLLPDESDDDNSHRCSMSLLDISGKELWQRCLGLRDGFPRATFSSDAKAIAVCGYGYTDTEEGGLLMLDSTSGDRLWEFDTGGLVYCASFAPDSRKIAAALFRINNGQHLVVLDAASGSPWHNALWVPDEELGDNDIEVVFSNDSKSIISAQFRQEQQATSIVLRDASSGAKRWQSSLESCATNEPSRPTVLTSPDGRIIAVGLFGSFGMLSAETGDLIWRRTHPLFGSTLQEFALSSQVILAMTREVIDALDLVSGNLMWQFASEDPWVVRSCRKWIAVVCSDGIVRVLHAASGKELWKWGRNGGERCERSKLPRVAFLLGGSLGRHATASGHTRDGMIQEFLELRHSAPSVLDDEIQHPPEPVLSSDEAFARTAERHMTAEQADVPVGQISPDWAGGSVICGASLSEPDEEAAAMAESCSLPGEAGAGRATSLVIEPVHLLEYSRTPESFGRSLEAHPVLRDCRCELQRMGFPVELASGARIFVTVDHCGPVLSAIGAIQEKLRPRHVIAQERFLSAISEAVKSLKGGKQVHEKQANRCLLLPLNSLEAANGSANVVGEERDVEEVNEEEKDNELAQLPVFLVKNTFIHVPIPSSLASEPSAGAHTV